jgi:hypothetical protein
MGQRQRDEKEKRSVLHGANIPKQTFLNENEINRYGGRLKSCPVNAVSCLHEFQESDFHGVAHGFFVVHSMRLACWQYETTD